MESYNEDITLCIASASSCYNRVDLSEGKLLYELLA